MGGLDVSSEFISAYFHVMTTSASLGKPCLQEHRYAGPPQFLRGSNVNCHWGEDKGEAGGRVEGQMGWVKEFGFNLVYRCFFMFSDWPESATCLLLPPSKGDKIRGTPKLLVHQAEQEERGKKTQSGIASLQ